MKIARAVSIKKTLKVYWEYFRRNFSIVLEANFGKNPAMSEEISRGNSKKKMLKEKDCTKDEANYKGHFFYESLQDMSKE